MKKIISILLILLIIPIVVAQDEEITEENVGTLPDSNFYGLKMFSERLSLALTFNKQKKQEKQLLQAKHRLVEMELMIEKNKLQYAEKAQQHYEKLLEKVEKIEITDPEKAAKFEERLQSQQQKLEQIRERVENKIELKQEQKERIREILNKVEDKTQSTRQRAIQSIDKNIAKLQEMENKGNAVQALNQVREKLQAKVQERQRNKIIVGESCGTVSPDSRDECCQRKGFNVWNTETAKCIGEKIQERTQTNTQQAKK